MPRGVCHDFQRDIKCFNITAHAKLPHISSLLAAATIVLLARTGDCLARHSMRLCTLAFTPLWYQLLLWRISGLFFSFQRDFDFEAERRNNADDIIRLHILIDFWITCAGRRFGRLSMGDAAAASPHFTPLRLRRHRRRAPPRLSQFDYFARQPRAATSSPIQEGIIAE